MNCSAKPIQTAKITFDAGTPFAPGFGDHYFMAGQGLAEAEQVFIQPNRLAERFSRLTAGEYLVIGETGFGTGLNMLLAALCFQQNAPPGARLHLISAELHPLTRPDLARALAAWPGLSELADCLIQRYPPAAPGLHRLELTPSIHLDLIWGDATWAWQQVSTEVDAWFLDGFAPSRNPGMWTTELFRALANRSRPGATFGSFTAAGQVRRGLSEAGFRVERVPGFANKRHRIEGQWPGDWQPRRWRQGRAVVAGAGLAGATTARALAERGWQVTVYDPEGVATQASGNLAGVVYSTPSAHLTPQNRFYLTSLIHALTRLNQLGFPDRPENGRLGEARLNPVDTRSRDKLVAAVESGAWPDELLRPNDDDSYSLLGAGYLSPAAWCQHLLNHPSITCQRDRLLSFAPSGQTSLAVQLTLEHGPATETDLLLICTAQSARDLAGLDWLPLKLIRGQVTHVGATLASQKFEHALCHSGYFTPALDGLHCVGASFDLHDPRPVIKPADDIDNLAQLRDNLPEIWQALGGEHARIDGHRAALRCQSRDFLPLAGALPDPQNNPHRCHDHVFLNIAHGSRGITHTPLCASLVADLASRLPLPADTELASALAPERFIVRKRRKQADWQP